MSKIYLGKYILIYLSRFCRTGASTAARLRRVDEKSEIIMFEKGEYISFANCGLPLIYSHYGIYQILIELKIM